MSLRREQLSTLQEAERDLEGPQLVYPAPPDTRATGFPCIPSVLRRGVVIQVGANEVEIQLEVKVRRDLFAVADSLSGDAGATEPLDAAEDVPLPVSGKLAEFDGWIYRVLVVEAPPGQGFVNLVLGDRHSGRRR